MCDDEQRGEFEDRLFEVAREIGRSVERISQLDIDEIARTIGVEPERAREWIDAAGGWLRGQPFGGPAPPEAEPYSAPAAGPDMADDPLRSAGPHPLDMPTDEQGLALAALSSGRWTIEPGSNALAAHGDGPGPNDALGLVRELHARDWISADGTLTPAGHHALDRWLNAAGR